MSRNYVNLNVNPCKMCMPMGASQAFKGIEKSMIIIHGSQGCSTYIRRHMAAHYNEPVDIASSSLSEEGTVYGGSKNLKIGIRNLVNMYNPDVIGVLTTCLAETIGDDIERIVQEVRLECEDIKADIIPVATPGYGASQTEGYYCALRKIVSYYSKPQTKGKHINIIVSSATSEDIRELKRILELFHLEYVLLPDTSDVFDAPYTENYSKLCKDGTKIQDIKKMSGAIATIEFGALINEKHSPGAYLQEEFDVPLYRLALPIGIKNVDVFLEVLSEVSKKEIPSILKLERGRMIDAMIDSHKHNALGNVAIFGDMELVYSISSLCLENGLKPRVVATGTDNKLFREKISPMLSEAYIEADVLGDSDFETIREKILQREVNLMIGHSDGKFIWEKDGIDLIRVGFPVHDHIGAQRRILMGYRGSVDLLDRITNTLLDQKHSVYRDKMYNTYYKMNDKSVV